MLDLERRFGTTRPAAVRQGAVHPGVPGSLRSGYNAAVAVAEEFGLAL